MALFSYQAFSKLGKKVSGTLDAPSLGSARELLRQQGFFPVTIIPTHKVAGAQGIFSRFFQPSISLKEKLLFTKQLAVLLRSGIQLVQALELLSEQFDGKMNRIIIAIKDGIKEGQSLADGLKQYPSIFENIYVQLVRSGEASGKLEVILERLTVYLEREGELRIKVSSALRGPLIQLVLIFAAAAFLMVLIVPQLADTFAGLGMELPALTRMTIAMSDFLLHHYFVLLGMIGTLVTLYLYWASTASGALLIDTIKLRIPIISVFTRTGAIVQFCSTLGMLLEGSVNLPEALDIVVSIVDNRVLKKSLQEAREKIIKQGQMAQYLKQTGIFPPMATYLINTGEQSGKLDSMLLLVGQNYEKELSEFADNLTVLISPIMTVVTSVIVGIIVLSIMLPMSQMSQMAK